MTECRASLNLNIKGWRAPTVASITDKGDDCIGVEALESLVLAANSVTGDLYSVRKSVTRL